MVRLVAWIRSCRDSSSGTQSKSASNSARAKSVTERASSPTVAPCASAAELLSLAEAHGAAINGDAAVTFAHERRIADLRALLATSPRLFAELAADLFTPDIDQGKALAALVTAGARLRDSTGSPVLSARYHLFARASEGAYNFLSKAGPHASR